MNNQKRTSAKIRSGRQPNYIDLFAGCGGLSLGLHNAGWTGLFAIEKSPDAFNTLAHNLIAKSNHFRWPKWLPKSNHDINEVLVSYKEELKALRGSVDLVVGGPPCQGFSTAGLRKEDDTRNGLIKSYLRFIRIVRPRMIFFENVKGFTLEFKKNRSKGKAYSNYVLKALRLMGYDVEGQMIDFSEYGIPQKRTRFILVGVLKSSGIGHAAKDFFQLLSERKFSFLDARDLPHFPTLENAISDLLKKNGLVLTPDRDRFTSGIYASPKSKYQKFLRRAVDSKAPDSHSFPNHSPEIEKRFRTILRKQKPNFNLSDSLRRELKINKHTVILLGADSATPTITTLPDDYIHYSEPRILTVREYARIQSFPDSFEFRGKYTTGGKARTKEAPRYTQIGNAIPPLFGEQSGCVLKVFLQ